MIWSLPICLWLFSLAASEHASIESSFGQLVTSSTLTWRAASAKDVNFNSAKMFGAVSAVAADAAARAHFVCRLEHRGLLITGMTGDAGSCGAVFVDRLERSRHFELLVNVDHAAELQWKPYKRFDPIPVGAVAGVEGQEKSFLGRHRLQTVDRFWPGSIQASAFNTLDQLQIFSASGLIKTVSEGEVLVELRAISYEVEIYEHSNSSHSERKRVTQTDVVLASSSLFRFKEGGDQDERLQKIVPYTTSESIYFGQIAGMERGLPATVRLASGQLESVSWGVRREQKSSHTLMVGHVLPRQSAVDVSVVGVRVREEQAYSAMVTTVFADGTRRERPVRAVMQRSLVKNVRPEYSRVYAIKDSVRGNSVNFVNKESKEDKENFSAVVSAAKSLDPMHFLPLILALLQLHRIQ